MPIKSCNFILSKVISVKEFTGLAFVLVVVFMIAYLKLIKRTLIGDIGVAGVLVGAALNLFERYASGCVYDYLNFFGLFYFNFADFLVSAGIILILINIWRAK